METQNKTAQITQFKKNDIFAYPVLETVTLRFPQDKLSLNLFNIQTLFLQTLHVQF